MREDFAVASEAELDEEHDRHALKEVNSVVSKSVVMFSQELLHFAVCR